MKIIGQGRPKTLSNPGRAENKPKHAAATIVLTRANGYAMRKTARQCHSGQEPLFDNLRSAPLPGIAGILVSTRFREANG